tara:strand:+ start:250 stop:444 length:195 start_codon:yes stop_codon:yes gene_type:complete
MFLRDWSELDENELTQALQTVKSLAELEGVANRRRVLRNSNLSMWSEAQKQIILQRKYELERHG